MKKIAFSGTLDPITNGHMWVIGEARAMAEEVTIFLSENPLKDTMLGADLAILGQEDDVYDTYAHAIRQEYSHVQQEIYNKQRRKALMHLRQKAEENTLYANDYFAAQYNDRAIVNMTREIAQLLVK